MYCAYITTIRKITKHPNADRLQCCEIFGNNVIVDLSYKEGDRVIYFPVDGQLGLDYASDNNLLIKKDENGNNVGGYLDPKKRNIKALKLRGEKSEGLVLPIATLSKYTNVDKLRDGDQITVLDGHEICCKYIPQTKERNNNPNSKTKVNKKKIKVIKFPTFFEHIDTQQLAFNEKAFKPGDICYITLKMHGTSARTANVIEEKTKKRNPIIKKILHIPDKVEKDYALVSGTRRTTIESVEGGYYGSNEFRMKYHDMLKDRLPKGMEVFYEIVGYTHDTQTIMGKCSNKLVKDKEFSKKYGNETIFSYGCEAGENDAYVYRMTMTNPDGYVVEIPWEQVQKEAEKLGFKCVPTFERFEYTTWEDLMERVEKYYDGTDPIGKTHIREGVVVRIDNRGTFTAFKHKNFYFKVLESIIKDTSDVPDIEEAEELINEQREETA